MSPINSRRNFRRLFLFYLLLTLLLGSIASSAALRGTSAPASIRAITAMNVDNTTDANFVKVSRAAARSTSGTYINPVSGAQNSPAPGVNNPLSLDLKVAGPLPGTLVATLDHNNSHEIVGGTWELRLARTEGDSASGEVGTLKGAFTGGTVAMNDDGTVAAINAAQVAIEGGTGSHSGVAIGTGTLEGVFSHASSPPFSGTFSLTF